MEREGSKELREDSADKRRSFQVAIFGTAGETEKDQKAISNAQNTAKDLIKHGFSLATGGYGGVMKAATEAAAEAVKASGQDPAERVAGYTLEGNEKLKGREVKDAKVVRSESLPKRLSHLIDESSGYIVLTGGQGTVVEMLTTLESERINKAINEKHEVKPLVIIDESLKMSDLLTHLARKEKKLQSETTADNVYLLSLNEEAPKLSGEIMEAYYRQGLTGQMDEAIKKDLSRYNLGSYLKAQENFEKGGGI